MKAKSPPRKNSQKKLKKPSNTAVKHAPAQIPESEASPALKKLMIQELIKTGFFTRGVKLKQGSQ